MNKTMIIILGIAFVVAIFASIFASSFPDGLEMVAEKLGFIEAAEDTAGMMPDYMMPGIESEALATIAAGIIGTAVMFFLFLAGARLMRSMKSIGS